MGLEARIELVVSWGDQVEHVTSKSDASAISERRAGMSFQRTRMSADRTLMSVIRTSLSLISFGFTIFQVFQKLRDQNVLSGAAPARNFGVTLVLLGIVMLVLGIVYHLQFMLELRELRRTMTAEGLVRGESQVPALADVDHRDDPPGGWRRRHPQHGVQDWTARLIRASKGGLKWR
jgi:putative membrane protein